MMMEAEILRLITELGFPATLVLLFIFHGWSREKIRDAQVAKERDEWALEKESLRGRINDSEKYIRGELREQNARVVDAMEDNTTAYKQVIILVGELARSVSDLAKERPCKYIQE